MMNHMLLEDPALREETLVYEDRAEAGKRLAGLLAEHITGGERVFAVPAGGVPLTGEEIREQEERTLAVMKEREVLFRKGRPYPELAGEAVILVDDGLASGYTMRAAIAFVRMKKPAALIVAVPTALKRTAEEILAEVDVLACPNLRSSLPFAVAEAYRMWHDLTDREVMEILEGFTKEG
jgi:predicted phosphoribosyltransferase